MSPEMEYNAMRMLAGVYDLCRCVIDEVAGETPLFDRSGLVPWDAFVQRRNAHWRSIGVARNHISLLLSSLHGCVFLQPAGIMPDSVREALLDIAWLVAELDQIYEHYLCPEDPSLALLKLADSSIPQWRAEVK